MVCEETKITKYISHGMLYYISAQKEKIILATRYKAVKWSVRLWSPITIYSHAQWRSHIGTTGQGGQLTPQLFWEKKLYVKISEIIKIYIYI